MYLFRIFIKYTLINCLKLGISKTADPKELLRRYKLILISLQLLVYDEKSLGLQNFTTFGFNLVENQKLNCSTFVNLRVFIVQNFDTVDCCRSSTRRRRRRRVRKRETTKKWCWRCCLPRLRNTSTTTSRIW